MNFSIKKRIYWSFALFVLLFVANGIASLITLNNNRKLSEYISTVTDPSLQSLEDFKNLLIESKMYTTNWVFLRSNQDDKDALKRLHNIDYPALKVKLNLLSAKWDNKYMADSLHKIFTGFEQLLVVEKRVMLSLQKFEDYDDPVAKMESEKLVQDELLPRTSSLMNALSNIASYELNIRNQKNSDLEESFMDLRMLISVLTITIIFIGIFLSLYMARVIISPINKIRHIVNNLGNGIIRKVNHRISNDEIGEMVRSVNNLSEKLQGTTTFAHEIGSRNFDTIFQPLSDEDTLGKALISMRDNLKTSELELLDANAEIQTIYNASLDAVIIIDEEGKIVKWDHKAEILFGWKEDEVMGTLLTEIIIPHRHREAHQRRMKHFLKTAEGPILAKTIEVNVLKKNKNEFDISLSISPSLIQGKYRFIGFIRDITERKIAEKELEAVNRELSILFNSIDEIFFSVNMTTLKVIQISATCEKVYGYKQSEFLANYALWFDIIHPDDKHVIENEDEEMRRGEQVNNQYRVIRKDKFIRWVETKITPTLDKDGNLIRVDGITRDITERKRAEAELRYSEERYRQIVETSQEGIWLTNEINKTNFVNKRICEILGYTPGEMMGKEIFEFMDEEGKQLVLASTERRKQGYNENLDFKYITKSGKAVWTNVSTNPVFDDAGIYKGALAMVTDITKRKHNEDLLQKSRSSLAINIQILEQKNRELEQFAFVASHDLQEPLRTISGFVELLRKQYQGKLDEKADKCLAYIAQSSDRMKIFIRDLLQYSRIGSEKTNEQVNCTVILHDVLDDLGKAIEETHADIDAGPLPFISGHPGEIKQLFQNLIVNAIKFRKKDSVPKIKISAQQKDDYWEFTFADNGIGIEEQHNETIFVIFQRLHTRSEYQGSGIGLSNCKKIVELHNGKIWVDSKPGEGSTFQFTIHQNNN